jgi:hypothetical protein
MLIKELCAKLFIWVLRNSKKIIKFNKLSLGFGNGFLNFNIQKSIL